jgi:hypothetical protein
MHDGVRRYVSAAIDAGGPEEMGGVAESLGELWNGLAECGGEMALLTGAQERAEGCGSGSVWFFKG